jgi:hypothetical protein
MDDDKLTFIILARHSVDELPSNPEDFRDLYLSPEDPRIGALPMVGDVNLFLSGNRHTSPNSDDTGREDEDGFEAEVEIMIAGKQTLGHAHHAMITQEVHRKGPSTEGLSP